MSRRAPRGANARRAALRVAARKQQLEFGAADPSSRSGAAQPVEPAQIAEAPRAVPQSRPVGEVVSYITGLLEGDELLQDLWVEGEVRNFNQSGAGHMYFRLADESGALSCVFFRGRNRGVRVEQGDEVLAHGQVGIYRDRGDLQLVVDTVRPRGTGVLQAEFERMKAMLEAEGLFAPERKRSLPRYPQRIGVVTSVSGAVWHDVQQVLGRRWPLATLVLSACLTQGDGAASSIAAALAALGRLEGDEAPDVVIVARGGGSPEDLWAYNEEPVARAIFASPIPVISAVGHETDFTIADFVADVRAPTPSAAAELVAPDRAEEAARVRGWVAAGTQIVESRAARLQQRLTESQGRLAVGGAGPGRAAGSAASAATERRADGVGGDERARGVAGGFQGSPRGAGSGGDDGRGYAMITRADGAVIASAEGVAAGERVQIRLHDGRLGALVESVERVSDD